MLRAGDERMAKGTYLSTAHSSTILHSTQGGIIPGAMVEAAVAELNLTETVVGNGKAVEIPGPEGNASLLKLEELGVGYKLYEHAEATTLEEQAAHVGHLPGVLTKNLLLRVSDFIYSSHPGVKG